MCNITLILTQKCGWDQDLKLCDCLGLIGIKYTIEIVKTQRVQNNLQDITYLHYFPLFLLLFRVMSVVVELRKTQEWAKMGEED